MPFFFLALPLCWTVSMPLYLRYKRQGRKALGLVWKAAGTLVCVAVALWAQGSPKADAYTLLVLAGLCVCICADVWLEIVFKLGGGLFFLGHMLYVGAFAGLYPPGGTAYLWPTLVFVASALLLQRYLRYFSDAIPRSLVRALGVYALALAALLAACLPLLLISFSPRLLFGVLGAALFVASDMLLLRNKVRKKGTKAYYLSLGTYYAGQFLLACSAYPMEAFRLSCSF